MEQEFSYYTGEGEPEIEYHFSIDEAYLAHLMFRNLEELIYFYYISSV